MNKKQFFASLADVYCRIARTNKGVGVVAIRTIPKGVNPFKHCDPHGDLLKIPEAELNSYPCNESVKDIVRDFFALQDGVYFVPDYGIDAIDKSYYLNHSKSPNMETFDHGETFLSAREIATGEELTADYDTYNEPSNVRKFKR